MKMEFLVICLLLLPSVVLAEDRTVGDTNVLLQHVSEEIAITQEMVNEKADKEDVALLSRKVDQAVMNISDGNTQLEQRVTLEMQSTKFLLIVFMILFVIINVFVQQYLSRNKYIEVYSRSSDVDAHTREN